MREKDVYRPPAHLLAFGCLLWAIIILGLLAIVLRLL